MKIDKETAEIMREAAELKNMVKGNGWIIVRRRLMKRMAELTDILMYDEPDPAKLMREIAANQQAIKILIEWVQEIEGTAQSADDYRQALMDEKANDYIKYDG